MAFLEDIKVRYTDLIYIYSYNIETRKMLTEDELSLCIREALNQMRENIS